MADQKPPGLLRSLLQRWPAYQDLQEWRRGRPFDQLGTGETAVSDHTRGLRARTDEADRVVPSICPYCAVGCEERDEQTGKTLNRCTSIASLGGATLDNEENYLIKKLFGAGLGMIWIENQARI